MVDDGGGVLCKVQFLLEVEDEDGFHAIVGEALAKLVAYDEDERLGEGEFLKEADT